MHACANGHDSGTMNGAKPKLLLFSHLCSANFLTGAEKLLILFAREWSRRFQCELVVPREGVIAAQARALGIPVIVFEIPLNTALYHASSHAGPHLEFLKYQLVYQRLLALLVRERPSCVFVNTCVHPLPAVAAKSLGIPVIWSLMEAIQPSPHRQITLDIIAGASDIIAGISRATLQPFQGHPGMAKSFVLTPYVAQEEWDPSSWFFYRMQLRSSYGWTENECVFGYVAGAIYPQKGLEAFVRAAVRLKDDSRARFFVVGNPADEGYYQACQALVRQAGMAHRFGWLRFEENVERIYPVMDAVVVTSLQPEGFGMTALEGMMFGKPVAAFASGGLAEILKATGNGQFLVRTGDVPGLATRMEWLLQDAAMRNAAGERNRIAAQAAFGVDVLRFQQDQLMARLPIQINPPSPLIRGSGRTVYLLENGRRRPFVSEKALLERGFRFEDVRRVSDPELLQYRLGMPITEWPGSRTSSKRRSRRKFRRKPRRTAVRSRSRRLTRRKPAARKASARGTGRRMARGRR